MMIRMMMSDDDYHDDADHQETRMIDHVELLLMSSDYED